MRRVLTALVLTMSALVLAGCSVSAAPETPTEHPLTTEEAQRLAVSRFNNFDAGTRIVSVSLAGSEPLRFDGWVDFAGHQGYGLLVDDSSSAPGAVLLSWDLESVAVHETTATTPTLPVPQDGWMVGSLDPGSDALHNVMAVILSLGSDRPDNPILLQQTDALWLRSDTIDGTSVDVFAGPSSDEPAAPDGPPNARSVLLWVDAAGLMLRVEIATGSGEPTRIDLGEAADVDLGAPASELPR